jgi:hypothetical protein
MHAKKVYVGLKRKKKMHAKKVYVGLKRKKQAIEILENSSILKEKTRLSSSFL